MEENLFTSEFGTEVPFELDLYNEDSEEPMWDALISKITDGNVIPIIGPDILIDDKNTNLHNQIINSFAKSFGVASSPKSFSELVYAPTFLEKTKNMGGKESIYTYLNNSFNSPKTQLKPSILLEKLLSSKLFPFVITTSFTPIVEQVMRKVWKDDLKILKFNNNPLEIEDINNEADLYKPTIFYMFGRIGDSAHRYAVTDQDMLAFCSSWLSFKTRPDKLVDFLKDKFLLMIGMDYSDWLFRFIWYSIRKGRNTKEDMSDMISNSSLEESFIHFMERNKTYLKDNPDEVIQEISKRIKDKFSKNPELENKMRKRITTKFSYPQENSDIFISYSRSDSVLVEKLYEELTKRKLNVWYDKMNLTDGGKFMEEIKRAIKTAKYFIPILSLNIEKEKDELHVYRNEWDVACSVGYGRTYIIPISENKFDFYNSHLPEKIQAHNAIEFTSIDDIPSIADRIINKIESNQ